LKRLTSRFRASSGRGFAGGFIITRGATPSTRVPIDFPGTEGGGPGGCVDFAATTHYFLRA
jgi:hypothetical protein